jgi:RecB family endonuclease NucS
MDRHELPVIVECKQRQPTVTDIRQLRGYLRRLLEERGQEARGILVHGGARKLRIDIARAAAEKPRIEVIQHTLKVEFSRCN